MSSRGHGGVGGGDGGWDSWGRGPRRHTHLLYRLFRRTFHIWGPHLSRNGCAPSVARDWIRRIGGRSTAVGVRSRSVVGTTARSSVAAVPIPSGRQGGGHVVGIAGEKGGPMRCAGAAGRVLPIARLARRGVLPAAGSGRRTCRLRGHARTATRTSRAGRAAWFGVRSASRKRRRSVFVGRGRSATLTACVRSAATRSRTERVRRSTARGARTECGCGRAGGISASGWLAIPATGRSSGGPAGTGHTAGIWWCWWRVRRAGAGYAEARWGVTIRRSGMWTISVLGAKAVATRRATFR